jgi:hypothetical protein
MDMIQPIAHATYMIVVPMGSQNELDRDFWIDIDRPEIS